MINILDSIYSLKKYLKGRRKAWYNEPQRATYAYSFRAGPIRGRISEWERKHWSDNDICLGSLYLSAITVVAGWGEQVGVSNTDKRGRGVIAEADLPGKGKNEDSNEGEAQSRNSIERAVHATRQRNEPTRYVRGFPEEARPASQSTFQPDTDAIQSGEKEAEGERESKK